MDSTDDSILSTLDAQNRLLLAHLPYLLQDLREIGTSADAVVGVLKKNGITSSDMSVIDLGCGKGAVSVKLAMEFGCKVRGIDALEGFIVDAARYAQQNGVSDLCTFQTGDIRKMIDTSLFDLVIYGAVGPIFGSIRETMTKVSGFVRPGGFLILDDSFCTDCSDKKIYHSEKELIEAFEKSGMTVIEESRADMEEMRRIDKQNNEKIKQRADELKRLHPQMASIFEDYAVNQIKASDILETQLVSALWLLQKQHTDRLF